jgi:hypothetical protein
MAAALTEKPIDAASALEHGHHRIQVHAVDTLRLEGHVVAQNLRDALC